MVELNTVFLKREKEKKKMKKKKKSSRSKENIPYVWSIHFPPIGRVAFLTHKPISVRLFSGAHELVDNQR
jgi:hypothetical protein